MAETQNLAALIADVVSSRAFADQKALFSDLDRAIRTVNERVEASQPLHFAESQGDELQGAYASPVRALEAALFLRLELAKSIDLRFGIGWGESQPYKPELVPAAQTGSAWWAARHAIEEASKLGGKRTKSWPKHLRSRYHESNESRMALVNALLLCIDQVLGNMDFDDARSTLGLFSRKKQKQIALELNKSQSVVSDRQRFNGPLTLYRAYELLRKVDLWRG